MKTARSIILVLIGAYLSPPPTASGQVTDPKPTSERVARRNHSASACAAGRSDMCETACRLGDLGSCRESASRRRRAAVERLAGDNPVEGIDALLELRAYTPLTPDERRLLGHALIAAERTAEGRELLVGLAEDGDTEAMLALGRLGGDDGAAWTQRAARNGSADAMYALGERAIEANDLPAGRRWMQRAADAGSTRASERLAGWSKTVARFEAERRAEHERRTRRDEKSVRWRREALVQQMRADEQERNDDVFALVLGSSKTSGGTLAANVMPGFWGGEVGYRGYVEIGFRGGALRSELSSTYTPAIGTYFGVVPFGGDGPVFGIGGLLGLPLTSKADSSRILGNDARRVEEVGVFSADAFLYVGYQKVLVDLLFVEVFLEGYYRHQEYTSDFYELPLLEEALEDRSLARLGLRGGFGFGFAL